MHGQGQGVRRGHLKFYVLRLLLDADLTGYGLMKAIEQDTGFWKPSTGSLYPLLSTMHDDGLIEETSERGGSPRWRITAEGRLTYEQAAEAKNELLHSMQRSLLVFSKVFGSVSLESFAERLDQWEKGRSDFQTLGPLFMDLHDALWALPPLSPQQEEKARDILEGAIVDLARLHPLSGGD
ncbi:helix-turn-helix transcriptional regulator [Candidatus Bipolaricaulota bacterium]|nr:helix-turn-helix transcriptional regulator [Candidatus Bipolaricaulota bacterium]